MTELPVTITVVAKVGPYDVDTHAATVYLAGGLAAGGSVNVNMGDGSTRWAKIDAATMEIVELQPGRWALKANAEIDTSTDAPIAHATDALDQAIDAAETVRPGA